MEPIKIPVFTELTFQQYNEIMGRAKDLPLLVFEVELAGLTRVLVRLYRTLIVKMPDRSKFEIRYDGTVYYYRRPGVDYERSTYKFLTMLAQLEKEAGK